MPFAVLFHHPARTIGSQLEITLLSLTGEALGLGWSSLALYISSATGPSRHGYAAFHIVSMLLAVFVASWIQAIYVRFHHLILSFIFATIFMETSQVSGVVSWTKAWNFGIPYMFGVVLCLVVNILIAPDPGHTAIHKNIADCLSVTREDSMKIMESNEVNERLEAKDRISAKSLQLSEAFREFCNEITITTASTEELLLIRNSTQIVISRLRAVTPPFSLTLPGSPNAIDGLCIIRKMFSGPAKDTKKAIVEALEAALGFSYYLRKGPSTSKEQQFDSLRKAKENLESAMEDMADQYNLVASQSHFQRSLQMQEVLDVLLHLYYLGETSRAVVEMLSACQEVCKNARKWRINFPSYPFRRAVRCTTAQVTHDRGGQTSSYFYRTKKDVDDIFATIDTANSSRNTQIPRQHYVNRPLIYEEVGKLHQFWQVIHRFQDFEARFAFKAAVSVALVSLPAWISSSRGWYGEYCVWFSVYTAYIGFHPRVAGNLNDVSIRTLAVVAGSIWGGLAMRARHANPYVIAAFSAIFMIPAIYRFIGTLHPRSGLLACASFTLVSLSMYSPPHKDGTPLNIFTGTWTRLVSLECGMVITVVLNWLFWPFVARTQVRKSVASLLSHISQSYLIVADRYLYRDKDDMPTELTLQLGEIREARLLQSLHAAIELLHTTKHEMTLRDDFNMPVYHCVLKSCASLFQKISQARISSMHFNVYDDGKVKSVTMLSLRRDAAASVIFVLDMLSGAYLAESQLPRILPSAALSRKLLFDSIYREHSESPLEAVPEDDIAVKKPRGRHIGFDDVVHVTSASSDDDSNVDADDENDDEDEGLMLGVPRGLQSQRQEKNDHDVNRERIWRLVHEAAFSRSFTEITEELERLIGYSKALLGEEQSQQRIDLEEKN